jgi:hypothetical protein
VPHAARRDACTDTDTDTGKTELAEETS